MEKGKVSLRIDTASALKKIEEMTKKLNELKADFSSKGYGIKPTMDTKNIEKAFKGLEKSLTQFGENFNKTNTNMVDSTTAALNKQRNAYQEFWKANLTDAQKYEAALKKAQNENSSEAFWNAKPKNVQSGAWLLMSNQARQQAAPLPSTKPSILPQWSNATPQQMAISGTAWGNYQKAQQEASCAGAQKAVSEYFNRKDNLKAAIDAGVKERAARQAKFGAMDTQDALTMEKVRQLRAQSAQMGVDRRQRHADQYDQSVEKSYNKMVRDLTSATRVEQRKQRAEERAAYQQKVAEQRELSAQERKEAAARRKAIQDNISVLQTQVGKAISWKFTLDQVNQSFQNAVNLYQQFSNVGRTVLTTIIGTSNSLLSQMGLNVNSLLSDAVSQEEKLQMARIGWGNMFGEDIVNGLEERVKTTAAQSPGLNSGDLATYISQIGAVAGDPNKSYDIAMGLLKTLQYGGADNVDQEMQYVIKNLRDVMAKGKATQIDIQQFNRAMPLLTKVLEEVGASELLKNGQLTITKENAGKLADAFARLNSADSPAADIFSKTGNTWYGVKEEFGETTQNLINNVLRSVNFYETIQGIMRDGLFPVLDDLADGAEDLFLRIANGTDWNAVSEQVQVAWAAISEAAGEVVDALIEAFAEVDENGNIDATQSLKQFVNFIKEFFLGLMDGVKTIIGVIGTARDMMGDSGLANLAGGLGFSVTAGSMGASLLGGVTNAAAGIGGLGLQLYQNKLLQQIQAAQLAQRGGTMATGGVASTGGKALNKLSTFLGGSGFNGKMVIGGIGGGVLSNVIGNLIMDFNLLGDASKSVGTSIDIAGGVIGGALTGLSFGAIGTVAGALGGLALSATNAQNELRKIKAQEEEEQVLTSKRAEVNNAVDYATKMMTSMGSNMDWASDEGKWVKRSLIKELEGMTQNEISQFDVVGRIAELMNMKQRQVAISYVDNSDAFRALGGNKAQLLKDNGDGTFTATEWGERLAQIIRANNLAPVDDATELENMSAATLIQRYLNKEGMGVNDLITDEQIVYLEEQSGLIAQNVAATTTKFATDINEAITAANGDITAAISAAKEGGKEALGEALQYYKDMAEMVKQTKTDMKNSLEGNDANSPEAVRTLRGDATADAVEKWNAHTAGLNGFWDLFFNQSYSTLGWLTGNGDNGATYSETSRLSWEAWDKVQEKLNDSSLSEQERNGLEATGNEIKSIIDQMNALQEGDWDNLLRLFRQLKDLAEGKGIEFVNKDGYYKDHDWWGEYGKAGGGFIKPIYRAGGGGAKGVDTIAAMLAPGEFVQRASAVKTAGLGVMNALNHGDLGTAYRLLGAKVSTNTNNSRNWAYNDSHNTNQKQVNYNFNYNRSAKVNAYQGQANFLAL